MKNAIKLFFVIIVSLILSVLLYFYYSSKENENNYFNENDTRIDITDKQYDNLIDIEMIYEKRINKEEYYFVNSVLDKNKDKYVFAFIIKAPMNITQYFKDIDISNKKDMVIDKAAYDISEGLLIILGAEEDVIDENAEIQITRKSISSDKILKTKKKTNRIKETETKTKNGVYPSGMIAHTGEEDTFIIKLTKKPNITFLEENIEIEYRLLVAGPILMSGQEIKIKNKGGDTLEARIKLSQGSDETEVKVLGEKKVLLNIATKGKNKDEIIDIIKNGWMEIAGIKISLYY